MGNNEAVYETKTKGLLKGGAVFRVFGDRVEIDDSETPGGLGSLLSLVGKNRAAVFPFADCLALEKDGNAVRFILRDGTAHDYSVDKGEIDAAYSFAAQAFKPYREKAAAERQAAGTVYVAVSGDGLVATAFGDRLELRKKDKTDVYAYEKIRLARVSTVRKRFELYLADGSQRAENIMETQRQGLLAAVKEKIAPLNALRQREAGIEFAVEGEKDGLIYFYDDRVEFVDFTERRTAAFPLAALQRAALKDGKIKFQLKSGRELSFAALPLADELRAGLLKFFNAQVNRPGRLVFGVDEFVQVDEAKKTLKIFQRGGVDVSGEINLSDVAEFAAAEGLFKSDVSERPLAAGGTTSLRGSLDNLKAMGKEKAVTFVGVELTTADGKAARTVKFGDFPKGKGESSKEYSRAVAETERFIAYLAVEKMKAEREIFIA